jgi:hypothetical protein
MSSRASFAGLAVTLASCQSSPSAPPAASGNTPPTVVVPATTPVATQVPSPSAPAKPVAAPSGPLTVAAISGMALGTHGSVRGVFLGWAGPCRIEPPTRSAWQLADGTARDAACLYVDGPMPPGVSPGAPPGHPVWVRVDAELQGAGPDRWLVARDVTRESP